MATPIRKLLIALSLMVLVAIVVAYIRQGSTQISPQKQGVAAAKTSYRQLLNEPRADAWDALERSPQKKCEAFWSDLARFNLSEWGTGSRAPGALPEVGGCSPDNPAIVRAQKDYLERCESYINDHTALPAPEVEKGCFEAIYLYRAVVSDWRTRDTPLQQISDPRILFDKFYASTVRKEFKTVFAIAERLLEVAPEIAAINKVVLVGRVFPLMMNADVPRDSAQWVQAHEALERTLEIFPDDPTVAEASLVLESRVMTDLEALRDEAEIVSQVLTTRPVGLYYLGLAEWNTGNPGEAKKLVAQAAELSPKEKRFSETLQKIRKAPPGTKGLFTSDVSFNLTVNEDEL